MRNQHLVSISLLGFLTDCPRLPSVAPTPPRREYPSPERMPEVPGATEIARVQFALFMPLTGLCEPV